MKSMRALTISVVFSAVFLGSSATTVQAQFSSGSDGSYGRLEALSGTVTVQVPPDGIFHCTTVTVASGATLKFARNSLNTPVYILAQGAIDLSGNIDIRGGDGTRTGGGAGGPGAFDGGAPGLTGRPAGVGFGPGAGRGGIGDNTASGHGSAAYGGLPSVPNARDGAVYGGPLLLPLVGGSGGGGLEIVGDLGIGGGGGGGAILLASDAQVTHNGRILAWGGSCGSFFGGKGSGGAIRIVAPLVTGVGWLEVNGVASGDQGGHGRIRIDTPSRTGLGFRYFPDAALSVGSFMAVFPGPLPRLDIVRAAGQAIPEGTAESVQVVLPTGSPTTQTIRVQARNFIGCVPIWVVLTPETPETMEGDRILIPAEIDMSTNPAAVEVEVTLPVNVVTFIDVWTRQETCPE